jgi:hypothetical protein
MNKGMMSLFYNQVRFQNSRNQQYSNFFNGISAGACCLLMIGYE